MMKRVWITVRALLAGVVFTMPVWAAAPVSGSARQYDPFDGSSTVIYDRKTKLEWTRRIEPKATLAEVKCSGARIPSLKELLTIFDEEPYAVYRETLYESRHVDFQAFGPQGETERTPKGAFWTSSPAAVLADGKVTHVWTLDFATGTVERTDVTAQAFTRCVEYSP